MIKGDVMREGFAVKPDKAIAPGPSAGDYETIDCSNVAERFEEPSRTWKRMVAGKMYIPDEEYQLKVCATTLPIQAKLNATPVNEEDVTRELAKQLFGAFPDSATVIQPVHCDYGVNVYIGEETFINTGAIMLDVAPIRIGNRVLIGPRVTLTTAAHPIDPNLRATTKLEYGSPITIEDNVWIGASVTIGPGVTIGENSIVGAGAVVMQDVPPNSIAVGVPAKVKRRLDSFDEARGERIREEYEADMGPLE